MYIGKNNEKRFLFMTIKSKMEMNCIVFWGLQLLSLSIVFESLHIIWYMRWPKHEIYESLIVLWLKNKDFICSLVQEGIGEAGGCLQKNQAYTLHIQHCIIDTLWFTRHRGTGVWGDKHWQSWRRDGCSNRGGISLKGRMNWKLKSYETWS